MTFYQKKHDIKLFRPLILPLTQVSKKHFPSLTSSEPIRLLLCVSHALDPPKKHVVVILCYMGFSNGVIKMSLLLKGPDTVYPVS